MARLGRIRRNGGRFTLLFHDTHHRAVSDAAAMADLALQDYDAVLAFGEVLRQRYLRLGWGRAGVHLARGGRHAAVPPAQPP